jgi:hypothetical protein
MEEDYDFSEVPVKEQEEAKKWFHALKPSYSRHYGGKILASYTRWVKWNVDSNRTYTGGLVKPLSYEGGPLWHRAGEREESEEESDKRVEEESKEESEAGAVVKVE